MRKPRLGEKTTLLTSHSHERQSKSRKWSPLPPQHRLHHSCLLAFFDQQVQDTVIKSEPPKVHCAAQSTGKGQLRPPDVPSACPGRSGTACHDLPKQAGRGRRGTSCCKDRPAAGCCFTPGTEVVPKPVSDFLACVPLAQLPGLAPLPRLRRTELLSMRCLQALASLGRGSQKDSGRSHQN